MESTGKPFTSWWQTLCTCCAFSHLHLIGQRSFSPRTAYPGKIFLSSRTNFNSVNWALINAQLDAAIKWLPLLGNSWTDRTSPNCWLITMISQSSLHTSIPCFSIQWFGGFYGHCQIAVKLAVFPSWKRDSFNFKFIINMVKWEAVSDGVFLVMLSPNLASILCSLYCCIILSFSVFSVQTHNSFASFDTLESFEKFLAELGCHIK